MILRARRDGRVSILAGFILIPYGLWGTFKATETLRRALLPVADCGIAAMLGVAIILSGLGLLIGAPIGIAAIALLAARRGLAIYNARLLRGRVTRGDIWPAAIPELGLSLLVILGSW
jgi:hypothetical protein